MLACELASEFCCLHIPVLSRHVVAQGWELCLLRHPGRQLLHLLLQRNHLQYSGNLSSRSCFHLCVLECIRFRAPLWHLSLRVVARGLRLHLHLFEMRAFLLLLLQLHREPGSRGGNRSHTTHTICSPWDDSDSMAMWAGHLGLQSRLLLPFFLDGLQFDIVSE